MTDWGLLPLLYHEPHQSVAIWEGQQVSRQVFLQHVLSLAEQLPKRTYAINMAENRYSFMVGFAAAMINGQTNLLPPSGAIKSVEHIASQYPDSYFLTDHELGSVRATVIKITHTIQKQHIEVHVPQIPSAHIACIAFTSGSTGRPSSHKKSWGQIIQVTKLIKQSFNFSNTRPVTIVATVPPQHMYGLETSVLLPWVTASCVYGGRPFYPEDIRRVLHSINGPKILVSTPIHLHACAHSETHWPRPELIISATAPLATDLAQKSEWAFNAPVMEIYGCTEFGSMAVRRTTDSEKWRLFQGLSFENKQDATYAHSTLLESPIKLHDLIEVFADNHFKLIGRKADMVNIAGKRASIADLNRKLLAIPGVVDGIIFCPNDNLQNATRLAAMVVAPGLEITEIKASLKQYFDAAFIPRPLFKVSQLPREKTGKIPRKNLLALFEQVKSTI